MIESIQELLQKEAQAVLNIPVTDAYEKAVELIVEQIHRKKGKLVTSGMGKAGQIAMNIATTFCSTGIPSVFLHPSEAQHGDLGILQENDLLLLISNSGKTREIVELTQLAHNLNPGLKFIVITGNPDSPLASESDVCLSTGHPAEVCTLGMTPTTSTTVMTVIGDILVVQTMKRTEFTDEAYIDSHASQRNDAVEYRASGNGCRRLVVPEDDIEYSLSDADYFTHSFLDFSPK